MRAILFQEILPNSLGPIIVLARSASAPRSISKSALSFLGFGLPPPTPTWGWTLAYGTRFIRDEPWLSIVAGRDHHGHRARLQPARRRAEDVLDPRHLARGRGKIAVRQLATYRHR